MTTITKNDNFELWPLIVLIIAWAVLVLIIIMMTSCTATHYIDSDPFYNCDTIFPHNCGLYEIT